MRSCPKCGAIAPDTDRFCAADGTPLEGSVPPRQSDGALLEASAPARPPKPPTCPRCSAPTDDAVDGYCSSCGLRFGGTFSSAPPSSVPPSNVPLERDLPVESDESYRVASGVHPGLRRQHNEDSVAFACGTTPSGETYRILAVCDGVSSSTHAEQASQIGARIVIEALGRACRNGAVDFASARTAMVEAIRSAHVAICVQGIDHGSAEPPGTTCVAAMVIGDRLVVGWVGDSRAYWFTAKGGELLTRDHSWVNEAVDSGEATLEEALRSPHAHALTRCLGPLEPGEALHEVQPDVVSRVLARPGALILCSDGLWNYYPIPEQMAALVQRCGVSPTPARLARFLLHKALARGGQDNVGVAVYSHVLS
jgi:serine/threonine protein phosphatase PrpC